MRLRKIVVERVTVVKFRADDRGSRVTMEERRDYVLTMLMFKISRKQTK